MERIIKNKTKQSKTNKNLNTSIRPVEETADRDLELLQTPRPEWSSQKAEPAHGETDADSADAPAEWHCFSGLVNADP